MATPLDETKKIVEEQTRTADDMLFSSIKENNLKGVREALTQGAHINGIEGGPVPLVIACCRGYVEIIKHLIEQGADVNKPDRLLDNYTPLLALAISSSDNFQDYRTIVEYLLDHKANMHHTTSGGLAFDLILLCTASGNLKFLSFLFERGVVIPHTRQPLDSTQSYLFPVLFSCLRRSASGGRRYDQDSFLRMKPAIQLWIDHGFDINYVPPTGENYTLYTGFSPLMIVCAIGDIPQVEFILSLGAKVNLKGGKNRQETALSVALMFKRFALAKFLIEIAGAETNLEDSVSLIKFAVQHRNTAVMRHLIASGAASEPDQASQSRINYLDLPEARKNPGNLIFQAVMRLFDYASSGRLHQTTTVENLLEQGAHLRQTTTCLANTPLHLALEYRQTKVIRNFIKILKSQGFSKKIFTAINREGLTPFDVAANQDNEIFANLIRNHLQPLVDHFLFKIKSLNPHCVLPPDILHELFAYEYGEIETYARTEKGITLFSEMFELAQTHYEILVQLQEEKKRKTFSAGDEKSGQEAKKRKTFSAGDEKSGKESEELASQKSEQASTALVLYEGGLFSALDPGLPKPLVFSGAATQRRKSLKEADLLVAPTEDPTQPKSPTP